MQTTELQGHISRFRSIAASPAYPADHRRLAGEQAERLERGTGTPALAKTYLDIIDKAFDRAIWSGEAFAPGTAVDALAARGAFLKESLQGRTELLRHQGVPESTIAALQGMVAAGDFAGFVKGYNDASLEQLSKMLVARRERR